MPVTRQRANRAVLAIDPAGQERRRRIARSTRDVWVAHEQDDHSLLMARMGTARALACLTAIDSAATDPTLDIDGRLDADATLDEVRDLLADPHTDATLRRLITDPMTGHLLDIGRDICEVRSSGSRRVHERRASASSPTDRTAPSTPRSANSTTPSPGTTAARPAARTSAPSAPGTTS